MPLWLLAQTWLLSKLHRKENGQGTVEYVLIILGVVLFLVLAAYALRNVLGGSVSKTSTWIGSQNAP